MQIDRFNIIKAYINRNKIILSDLQHPARKHAINLHWWVLKGTYQNIGDMLSPVVIQYIKEKCSLVTPSNKRTSHLYAIGSIIDGGYQDAIIWGSGLLRGQERYWWHGFRKLDIRAVRGPETRRILLANGYPCPECFDDPAILMPLFYQPLEATDCQDYVVVPHIVYGTDYPNVLSPYTDDWKSFIDRLVATRRVISSSLHGIILAESYGIRAILLNDHNMNLFKYQDYYQSTGRMVFPIAHSVEEALTMEPAPIPDFTEMRQNLLDAFPYDLWSRS